MLVSFSFLELQIAESSEAKKANKIFLGESIIDVVDSS